MLAVTHANEKLARLEVDAEYTADLSPAIVKQFRILMQIIRTVPKKNALYQFGGRRLEKLSGTLDHQHSMRLNRKYRLIVEFSGIEPDEHIVIVGIENHYD